MHLRPVDSNRAPHENVIDQPDDHVRTLVPVAKRILITRIGKHLHDLFHRVPVLRVQIARDHDHRVIRIMCSIREYLLKLGELDAACAAALQVQVVHHQPPSVKLNLRNQCDAPSEPPLKQAPCRQVGMRFPEPGLILEAEHVRR